MGRNFVNVDSSNKHRFTRKEKEADDFKWYRERIDRYDTESVSNQNGYGDIDEYKRLKVNYDLFNNIIDLKDFEYVCSPFGAEAGELPASMVNRDIVSYRIKSLLGMELKRPFNYKCMAINKEATTRREQEEAKQITDYVIDQILLPIRQEVEMKYQQDMMGGQQLTPQQMREIQTQMESEIQSKTPPEVKKYMERDHQDPAEVLGHQLTQYLIQELDVKKKFNDGFKHATLSAYEIYWVGIVNDKPVFKVVNPLRFACDKSPDVDYIEDGRWAVAEYRMSPLDVVNSFDLTDAEIDSIMSNHEHYVTQTRTRKMFSFENTLDDDDQNTVRVVHVQFKDLRKIGWLDYIDADGVLRTKVMVDEQYRLNKAAGDVRIKWEWINEVYEGWKIGTNIYKDMQPVKGQLKDQDKIYTSKLSYKGAIYDNMNSQPTAPMDRMKVYQYYYNIVMYRLELLLSSDKGKKVLMNIKAIPEAAGIDVEKWQYFFESSPFMWYSTDEEGMSQADVNTIAKTIDLSLASDINRYIELAEYLEQKCGKSVGITDSVLGQTSASKSVTNNEQDLIQTSHILEPYYALHDRVKVNVLNALLDTAKIAYSDSEDLVLNYVLDDLSRHMLRVDTALLNNSTLGLFIENGGNAQEIKDTVRQLAHAAMQNQTVEFSDVLAVMKETGSQEAEEILKIAEKNKFQKEQANAEAERKFKAEEAQKERDEAALEHERQKELIILKEGERRKTEIQKQAILSVGFNEDKDTDNDGQLDAFEIAQNGLSAQIEMSKEARENRALDHQIENDREKIKVEKMKIQASKNKKNK